MIDWMTAEAGDPEADIPRMLSLCVNDPDSTRLFLGAYRSVHPERDGFSERFPVYMLWDRLHIWEYGQRNHIWFDASVTMRQWIEPFTAMLDAL